MNLTRWLVLAVVASLLAGTGLLWAWHRRPVDPLGPGLAAYARRDWESAARLARERLKHKGALADRDALRLLARASARLGRDDAATAIFDRIGAQNMQAEDLYLLGVALNHFGNSRGAVEVWEQAVAADPNHAEALWELSRTHYEADRLAEAALTSKRLAAQPGWHARGEALRGMIQALRHDPQGALVLWESAREKARTTGELNPDVLVPRKELARTLLQASRPAEARAVLERGADNGTSAEKPSPAATRPTEGSPAEPARGRSPAEPAPTKAPADPASTTTHHSPLTTHQTDHSDAETAWLLSRAYLQEGATAQALAKWEQGGSSFREANPLLPEPAAFVGSRACASCHSANFRSQQQSRHARSFARSNELGDLELPAVPSSEPPPPVVSHALARTADGRVEQTTKVGGELFHAIVDYAFGSGDRGLTLVGRDDGGQARELRISRYQIGTASGWDVTSGQHESRPTVAADYLGRTLSEDAVRRCLLCHVTEPQAILALGGPVAADRGIGCEKCHGPGGNHLLAVAAKLPDLAIGRPTLAAGAKIVNLCAMP